MRLLVSVLLVLSLQFSLPSVVHAQLWLADRAYKEGPGFKIGESLVLHVGLGTEVGYDSNVMYLHDPAGAGRFRVTPYVDIATRSAQRLKQQENASPAALPKTIFSFGFASYYDRYFARSNEAISDFNKKTNPFGFDTHLNFTLLPERKVSVFGGATYLKTLEPYESASDAQSKHNIVPMIGVRIMPGGGTLSIEPKYRLNLLIFDEKSVGVDSNRFAHEISLSTNWKILPKTALISNVMFCPTVYFGERSVNVDSYPVRSWFGAQGLLLDKFGFRALLGYGAGFYEYGPNFEGMIGDGALMFYFGNTAKAAIGVKRDFVDSFYGNYYVMNGGYANYEYMFKGRLSLRLEGSVYKRIYAYYVGYHEDDSSTAVANTDFRRDVWISASALSEWRATEWLVFHMSIKILKDVTPFSWITTDEATGESTTEAAFSKWEVFVGVRAHY